MTAPSIGIPRSILHYEFDGQLASLLEGLGVRVVLSPPTNRDIFLAGKRCMLDEICFPVKAFAGHVAWLLDHDVDAVLVPVLVGHENGRVFPCHVRTRLSDIVVALGLCPRDRLLSPVFRFDELGLRPEGFYDLGAALGASVEAVDAALAACRTPSPPEGTPQTRCPDAPTVALLGHPYVVQDPWLNGYVARQLRELGCSIRVAASGEFGYSPEGTGQHFDLAARTLTLARQWDTDATVDGIVFLLPFNCGPDGDIARYLTQTTRKPLMTLVLDELRSDGGMRTRMEAFVDLMSFREPARRTVS